MVVTEYVLFGASVGCVSVMAQHPQLHFLKGSLIIFCLRCTSGKSINHACML